MTTIETLKRSLHKTKLEANKLFASESAKEDLYIAPFGDNPETFKLASTSGTVYFVGAKEECLNRQDELLLFALTGH